MNSNALYMLGSTGDHAGSHGYSDRIEPTPVGSNVMLQFHILSFEGPDGYARAGGIASRVTGLAQTLGASGFETHVWFVGDPSLPGHESDGNLHLHRWCQWISAHHAGGVYDGEFPKADDYASSLPPYMVREHIFEHIRKGGRVAILAEEWHTVHAVLHLHWLLCRIGMRDRVHILWNANNTFGFHLIDWAKLDQAATITTVSRYMKYRMRPLGVDPLVIPNGLESDAFATPDRGAVIDLHERFEDRPLLVKMARFDPDKRWMLAMDTIAELKRRGRRPLLVARGGLEAHGAEVLARARSYGLRISTRKLPVPGPQGLLSALQDTSNADIIQLDSHVDTAARRVLFRSARAVLANSGHEPFGLVGLEVMAAGGVACTGCSGEDYAVPGQNALVLETDDPQEFVQLFERMNPLDEQAMRIAGRQTAQQYAWDRVVDRALLPRVDSSVRSVLPLPQRQLSLITSVDEESANRREQLRHTA
jgi:glycosyltransferase involved in cell wall biosynthesis